MLYRQRWNVVVEEFAHHLPFTIVGSLLAMAAVWLLGTHELARGGSAQLWERANPLFHLFHALHVCLSAIATTSLYLSYERRLLRAVLVGTLGTITACGLSDYLFPYIGGRLVGQQMALHICIVDHPQLFFSFLLLGLIGGIWAEERLTGTHLFSHGGHVFVSSSASLLYLSAFGFTLWMQDVRFVFPALFTVVLAVWVPCCISDIVVPVASAHMPRALKSPSGSRAP